MTSEEDILQARIEKKMTNSPDSSEGEDNYDDSSYGSEFQPPDITPGFVKVHENCCRARYRKSRADPNDPFLICLNKSTCRSLAGGNHAVLRGGQRAEPGTYEGSFSRTGRLLAAKAGTRTTPESLKLAAENIRNSDRAQAAAIQGLTKEKIGGGLSSSKFLIQKAQTLTAESDQEAGGDVSGSLAENPSENNAIFLDVLSSLVNQIEQLDARLTKTDTMNLTIYRELEVEREKNRERTESILKAPSYQSKDREPVSLVAEKYAAASAHAPYATEFDSKVVVEKEDHGRSLGYSSGEESDMTGHGNGEWAEDKELGRHDKGRGQRHNQHGESRGGEGQKQGKKPMATRKHISGQRLYVIACGRGGSMTTGLYQDTWDNVEFLVSGWGKSRYKKVRDEKEGVDFIKRFYRAKGLGRPPCFKEGRFLYPRVSKIRRCLGLDMVSSDNNSIDESGSDIDVTYSPPSSKPSASKLRKVGVDPSLGKENKLFGIGVKSVNVLEAGLAPMNTGKKTTCIFWNK